MDAGGTGQFHFIGVWDYILLIMLLRSINEVGTSTFASRIRNRRKLQQRRAKTGRFKLGRRSIWATGTRRCTCEIRGDVWLKFCRAAMSSCLRTAGENGKCVSFKRAHLEDFPVSILYDGSCSDRAAVLLYKPHDSLRSCFSY